MSGLGISGLGSGVDWNAYVDGIIAAEQRSIANTLGRREVNVSAEKTVFANIKGAMDSLGAAIRGFRFSGDFKTKSVTSSDTDKVTGTATLSALKQNFKVTVQSLAQSEVQRFTFASIDDSIASSDTTIHINVRGVDHEIEVTAGTTFAELKDMINSARIGVTCAVFDSGDGTGEPARLTITDNTVGDFDGVNTTANIECDFTGLLGTLATQDDDQNPTTGNQFLVQAQNCEITINGDTIIRDSNTINDVVPGVTLTLLDETDVGEEITINVIESTKNAAEKMANMVSKYNDVLKALKAAVKFDPTLEVQTNPTAGNSTLRNVLSRMTARMTETVTSIPNSPNAIRSLADLGVTSSFDAEDPNSNGILAFDQSKFNEQLAGNFDNLVTFFEGEDENDTGFEGFADKLSDVIDSFNAARTGALTTKISSIDQELSRINDDKLDKLERLASKEERLRRKFAHLEGQMAALSGQQNTLNQSIQALSLNNTYIANRG